MRPKIEEKKKKVCFILFQKIQEMTSRPELKSIKYMSVCQKVGKKKKSFRPRAFGLLSGERDRSITHLSPASVTATGL